jgi:hypothetical protein
VKGNDGGGGAEATAMFWFPPKTSYIGERSCFTGVNNSKSRTLIVVLASVCVHFFCGLLTSVGALGWPLAHFKSCLWVLSERSGFSKGVNGDEGVMEGDSDLKVKPVSCSEVENAANAAEPGRFQSASSEG